MSAHADSLSVVADVATHREPVVHHPRAPMPVAERYLATIVFSSRWLQAPLYLGLIMAQAVYVILFMKELWHLLASLGSLENETEIMLTVLGLIDVVMISNLLIMVIIGGYETFVSRLRLDSHPDRPEWLTHVNANTMKIKLALALIGISSINLLKAFIDSENLPQSALFWKTLIHVVFLLSSMALAFTAIMSNKVLLHAHAQDPHAAH